MKNLGSIILVLLGILFYTNLKAQKIENLYFFDVTGNSLFSVAFNYSGDQIIGRVLYDKNDFVLSLTTFEMANGKTNQEIYRNTLGELAFTSAYTYTSNSKSGLISNQFNELRYSYSYNLKPTDNQYVINNPFNKPEHKLEYINNQEGALTKINVYNASDQLTHYIKVRYEGETAVDKKELVFDNRILSLKKLSESSLRVTFQLKQARVFNVRLFNYLGTQSKTLVNDRFLPGEHTLDLDINSFHTKSGQYILTLELDGHTTPYKVRLIK